ncbi:MAG: cellulose synthase family protein [Dehalococcoidia bacterium]|jgi:cellulose synthase/poly-beta-1,6-N-acetylglucosamine synthase-like glycosyltransferase
MEGATGFPIWMIVVFIIYTLPLLFIFLYSLTQVNLVYQCAKQTKKGHVHSHDIHTGVICEEALPFVTVQLPIFNEMYVVERLIDAVIAFDYPRNKLEIQVLDDSTDETSLLVNDKVQFYKAQGVDITHVQRSDRNGFKAGALANGLTFAKGEFIAIFDADFLPRPDFLRKTIPWFEDCHIGMVQTKWEHINDNYSLLTRLQAFGLDAHFNIEQRGRNCGGYYLNFNGTAGIWRKDCIIDGGNWQSDTLTEDLDLSYRAQLKGWKFKYLAEEDSPSELPVTMSALKTQQFRWTKGAAECARKNLPGVLGSKNITAVVKIHALFHLTNNMVFPCIFTSSVLSIPFLFIKSNYAGYTGIYLYASFSLLSLVALGLFYWTSESMSHKTGIMSFIVRFITFLSFSMGFSLHNTVAVFEGYAGKKIPFIRTPKYNISTRKDSWKNKKYQVNKIDAITFVECAMAIYFAAGIFLGLYLREYALLPFHIMLSVGFATVAGYSLRQASPTHK